MQHVRSAIRRAAPLKGSRPAKIKSDLLMGAPSEVTPKQLCEPHIRLNLPEKSE
jgi:hypothetical protein